MIDDTLLRIDRYQDTLESMNSTVAGLNRHPPALVSPVITTENVVRP